MITMLATLCHMATVSPGMPAIEFCQEYVIAQKEDSGSPEEITACYIAAQAVVAQRLKPDETVKEIRCATDKDGKDKPRNAI